MNKYFRLVLIVSVLLSGCGVDWFPESTSTSTNNGTTTGTPVLTKKFTPATILAGTDSSLTFTITNSSGNPAQNGLGFSDQLSTSLTVTTTTQQCGGTVSVSGAKIVFSGGKLDAGTTDCTITATILAAPAGSYVNKTTDITGLAGGLKNSVSDQTLTVIPASVTTGAVTVSNLTTFVLSSDANFVTYGISAEATNSAATDATVTVSVIAIDANGAEIASTATTILDLVPQGTTQPLQLAPVFLDVPVADAANILFWRILTVSVQ